MSGEIRLDRVTLSQRTIDDIKRAHLQLDVMVDCSHNQFVRTLRSDRPKNPIISKPIELDTTLSLPILANSAKALGASFKRHAAPARCLSCTKPLCGLKDGFDSIKKRAIKIEFSNFDKTMI